MKLMVILQDEKKPAIGKTVEGIYECSDFVVGHNGKQGQCIGLCSSHYPSTGPVYVHYDSPIHSVLDADSKHVLWADGKRVNPRMMQPPTRHNPQPRC